MTTQRRPVAADAPQARVAFIDPKTGCLTPHGLKVIAFLWERSGGLNDDMWDALGLGFQSIASQGRTDLRLQGVEGAVEKLAGDVGGLRGDPRLQTADRADATARDALAIALSRASPDVARRVEELERAVSVLAGALGEIRAQTQLSLRQSRQDISNAVVRAGFDSSLQAYIAKMERDRLDAIGDRLDGLEDEFDTSVRAAVSATAPVLFDEPTGVFSLNASLTSLGGLSAVSGRFAYTTGSNTWALGTVTTFGRSLLDDADATAGRTTLGLGSLATLSSVNNGNWSGTALAVANGGTGATSAASARTGLGLVKQTGWAAATGTATRTTFATSTVTLPQLAERVKALIDDLTTFNAIGA